MNRIVYIAAIIVALSSCKKDEPAYNPALKGELTVEFDNVVGSSDLQMNTGSYTNGVGQSFNVTKLKYYVSNFKFTNADGSEFVVPQNDSYFLIDESVASSLIPKFSVPEGEYTKVSFILGVDSLRNTMDVSQRTGVLDVSTTAADMYWSWNSGYIFFKFEGTSPGVAPFKYHVGGFGGYSASTANNLRSYSLDLTSRGSAKVKATKPANVHLFVDVLQSIKGTTNMTFGSPAEVHSPAAGAALANNYVNMIKHDHTEN
ncbi:MAG: MbnP family protein [Chitinophagaceae bacterium]